MTRLNQALSKLASRYGVPKPSVKILSRDKYFGSPPEDGGYYRWAKGRFLPPGETFKGSYRGDGKPVSVSDPMILLFAPQGKNVDTLAHEFSHYLEWLDDKQGWDSHIESDVRPYESDVGSALNDLGL